MVGIIATTIIAIWFFRTAERLNLPIFQWVVGGIVVYYSGFAACMYLVLRPMLGVGAGTHSFWLGLVMDLVSASVGIGLAALFRAKVMVKAGDSPAQDAP
ncbi:MAG: hypothetical protein H6R26_1289 [Proteobacteria bacterium]|nr:hypothetical protein [Pseudomonadota bacterium]